MGVSSTISFARLKALCPEARASTAQDESLGEWNITLIAVYANGTHLKLKVGDGIWKSCSATARIAHLRPMAKQSLSP